jgi:hypothetical protein
VRTFAVVHRVFTLMQDFLLFLRGEFRQVSHIGNDLPHLFIIITRLTEGGHSRPAHTVLDDPVEFTIRHFLRVVRAKVGGTGIHDASELRLTATVISVADGTMLLVMPSCLDEVDSFCFQGILHGPKAVWNGAVVGLHRDAGFQVRRFRAGAEAFAPENEASNGDCHDPKQGYSRP